MKSYVSLEREFSPISKDAEEADNELTLLSWGLSEQRTWRDLESEYRCVILAEAGAGKSVEFYQQALKLDKEGKYSFYLRIEDITADFQTTFEVGCENRFKTWRDSTDDAWFFLDSVDEARLDSPDALRKALRFFKQGISQATQRAHIFLSSRPYAWRFMADRELIDRLLYLPARRSDEEGAEKHENSALHVYSMRPLDEERIRRFCHARNAQRVDEFLQEIDRANLWSLAERPFDLEALLSMWEKDGALGGQLHAWQHNIKTRLRDAHNVDRSQRQPLNLEKALSGARRLAAAVLLTGKSSIAVPDNNTARVGIDPEKVLQEWEPDDVRALLERAVFNDILYGAVRFRHRQVRELLAAEWFAEQLHADTSRRTIEALFFRQQYGEKIIPPRLRAILPWLILFDHGIQEKALKYSPEIAVEGGEPGRLPIETRKTILADIVERIARNEGSRSARDNNAIARIANPDLAKDTHALIAKHINNDDVIVFLGRLVWQGKMASCAESFINIATDDSRSIYARMVSVRVVFTCGAQPLRQRLWNTLNNQAANIPRELLAEIVEAAHATSNDVAQILVSLQRLPPYERAKGTALSSSLHHYIDRLSQSDDPSALVQLVESMHRYLTKEPFIERGECYVSKEYAWLLNPATHAVEQLVRKRHPAALQEAALFILISTPVLKFWTGVDYSTYKGDLDALIPAWPELNDALFWASIALARVQQKNINGARVTDTYSLSWIGHYWAFDEKSLPRLFGYMHSRADADDRRVALGAAYTVYIESGKPDAMLKELESNAACEPGLQEQLAFLLNPPVTDAMRKFQAKQAKRQKTLELKEKQQAQARESWISALRENPRRLSTPTDIANEDIFWLMQELQDTEDTSRSGYANWRALIPVFGEPVARAYRDAAVDRWRSYTPAIRSETPYNNSIPYAVLLFSMAGITIEAAENRDFPDNLSAAEARHLLRYIVWELNGLPGWFEKVYQSHPETSLAFVTQELLWQLDHAHPEQPKHYILEDVAHHAPWLHDRLATVILEWLQNHSLQNPFYRQYCLNILVNGKVEPTVLTALAQHQISVSADVNCIADWYALYVDCDPDAGIPALSQWLEQLDDDKATLAAQVFVTSLVGKQNPYANREMAGNFKTAEHLKSLYLLMHQYIRADEDINRIGQGTFSPVLRDDAQKARNLLFNMLDELPGKASYLAIRELIEKHPDKKARRWMKRHAYDHAVRDGDIEPWSEAQIVSLESRGKIIPQTHHQLFDIATERLLDIKDWLELGNDSPARTWQKVDNENEMRHLITGALNQRRHGQFTTAQEPEIATSQRMDIWLQNTHVDTPVPIELKLLDKQWTGPDLCERLINQLIGGYMREKHATCGIMLLVWIGAKPDRQWRIHNKQVGLEDIAKALKAYWRHVAPDYPDIDEIQVILIDLGKRLKAHKS